MWCSRAVALAGNTTHSGTSAARPGDVNCTVFDDQRRSWAVRKNRLVSTLTPHTGNGYLSILTADCDIV